MNSLKIALLPLSVISFVYVPVDDFGPGTTSSSSIKSSISSKSSVSSSSKKFSSSKKSSEIEYEDSFIINSDWVGPFDNGDNDMILRLNIKSLNAYSNIRESFQVGVTPLEMAAAETKGNHSVSAGGSYTCDFNFPGSLVGKYGKRYFKFVIMNMNTNNILYQASFEINRPEKTIINGNAYINRIFVSQPLGFRFANSQIEYLTDQYDFRNTIDFINEDYYYRLELGGVSFKTNSNSLTYYRADIAFDDEENVFPYFTRSVDGRIHLPIKIINNANNEKTFAFKNGFYVNRYNLEMSDKPGKDFVPTNYFYLPINDLEILNQYKFNLEIYEFGANKSNIILTLDFNLSQRLIGGCNVSSYCVVGGVLK